MSGGGIKFPAKIVCNVKAIKQQFCKHFLFPSTVLNVKKKKKLINFQVRMVILKLYHFQVRRKKRPVVDCTNANTSGSRIQP